ncbi:DBF4-type zinc finger-containing protein 2 isoform X2 [Pan troglodytes]|uniref:Zinc finger DBF-type containing 2 n=1 Tax=Pan troglodytes TaxID=9598 RepID=A0A2I3TPZ6_PANTR|nr:DBF4-type zinc finger-containing protein 2 isoform X2 [Pan troglodytes]XP_054535202.1 DBF4-type zinc finger-containing protein 2 isoform X2 [Pan troglodytes]XP_054535203.1 DBF4-type zinc finger-containing protein 2 isoform X2 [Pan troglodytes]
MIPDGSSEIQEVMKNSGKHLFSAQHRSLTRQSRRQICTSSLMERFLQDVLQHHPYHCQESSSTQDETHVNTGSSSEVVHLDDAFSEEEEEDEDKVEDEDATEERPSEVSEPIEELHSRPHKSQEGTQEVSVRPSVIQKLEKGQQQPLEFVHKIGASVKKCNLVDIGQATNNRSNLVRPPVICNAPASCLPESSNDRPVTANTTSLPPAAHLDSVSKCDPNKVEKYLEQPDGASRNPVPSSHVETTSFSYQKHKESNRKSLHMNSDKLVLWKDVKSQGKTLSAGLKFHERMGTKGSLRVKSPSKLAVNLNKTDMPSNKGIFEDTIAKNHEEFFSNMDCTQEEKHLVFNKTAFWEQKCSVSSEMKFECSSLQSASDQPQETAQDLNLWKEEQIDQEDNYESRGSEMSFDCSSSFHSLTDQSKVSAKEVNLSKEVRTDVQYKNNKSYVSKISSDCDDILHLVTNQSQMIVKEISLQNARHISLVDQSYESSSSETNFDCDASPQSTSDYPQQSVTEVNLPKEVHIGLVDKNYGSSSSEVSADSVFPLQSVVDRPPVAVTETKLRKKAHTSLVDNYGSSCSETSFDCDVSLESVVDHPQLTVKGRNLKGRQVHLKHKKRKPSSAKAHLDCDVSLGTVADESQRAVEKINLLKEKNADLMDMNCESHGPEMGFQADAQLADQSQVAEIEPQKVDVDLENKSIQSSRSSLSSDSPASLYHSAHDEPQEALDEVNLKELNIDMEVKSYDCSSSELTFDSDPPLLSVTEQSHLDAEGKERHIDLEDESCESDSSEITFDSDIPLYSVIDQPEVAVYEEETVDLESKSNESCVSEITFDSDIPLHSGNDHPEVAVKEVIQKEEYIHLERKNDEPSGSEISSDSHAPLHSVTNSPEVAVKKLNPQKEEQVHLENKENEPIDSEVSLDYNIIFHSVTGRSEDPIKEISLHTKEHMYLEHKSVFEASLDSDVPLQAATHKPEVIVKETWLQREKHAEFQGRSTEFSGSKTSLDSGVPHYSVTEPQVAVNKINRKKQYVLENKNDKCSGSEIILDSNVPPQSMTDQPQLAFLKEKHVNLKDKNSKSGDSKITFDSEQLQEAVKKIDQWKEEVIGLKNKINEPSTYKLIHHPDVSVQSVADQPKVAIKHVNLGNENHMYLEVKNSQYSCSEMNLDSGFLGQSIVNRPQITILEQEHIELEGKHNQCCGSEVSFDSDDPLQSVADRLRETVKEISLWKDEEVDTEDRRNEAKGFEIMYDSDVLQPVAGQPEEVVKEVSLWKEHVDLENKIVKPTDSRINFDSHEPLQSVTNKIPGANKEINLLREEHVCLDDKGYVPSDSEIIYVSNIPLQSVIKQPHILEEEHASLEDKSSNSCSPEESSDSNDSFQAAADELQKPVKEINLWKEDHIYLEDKSYKLGDFDVSYASHIPVQFVTDQSSVPVKEINLQKKDHNDLENKNCEVCGSEINCHSCVHLQSEVDQPQVSYKEADLQKEEHVVMEEKTDQPSDSEMMYDSDVPFQIVVNQFPGSVKETHLPKVVLVDLVPSDSDYEVISDDIPLQLVTDPPQLTVKDINCINTECIDIEDKSCDFFGSEVRCNCKASTPSMTNQCKETFKIINRKKDYIILGEPSCQSCGSEMNFNVDASDQSMTYESQGPDEKMVKYIDSEDKSCGYNGSKGKFNLEDTSHRTTHRLQKAHKEASLRKDTRNAGLKGKSCQSSASAVDFGASSKSVLYRRADKKKRSKLKHRDLEVSCEPDGFEMNFQCAPPLLSDTDQPQETVKKRHPCKKVSFDLKEKNRDSQSSSVPKVDSVRNLKKAKDVIEDNPDEPVLEALPHVPPSFVGKTWSQIMREDDIKINALVKEFREGRFHCYFDDDCETKKVSSKGKKKVTWADLQGKEDTAPTQAVSESDDIVCGISDIDDLSVALDKPCHRHPPAERPPKQKGRVASQCQTAKISHSTQTSCKNYPVMKRKIIRQEEDPPKSKCSRLQDDRKTKKKVKIGTVEFPASCTKVLKPMQPKALVCVLSSLNIKLKEGEGLPFPKMRHHSWDNDIRFICKYKRNIFDYYEPLIKQIVISPPLSVIVPEFERRNWVKIHFNRSNQNSSAGDNDADGQGSASAPLMAVPARYGFNSHQGTSDSSLFLEESKVLHAREVPKKRNFQLTFLNRDVVKISPKSVRNKLLESQSKKKIHGKRVTTSSNKLGFPKKVYKPIILQQKPRKASEKQSIWIRTKPSDIIRKYISKYSVFLRHRYQSKSAFLGRYLKKKKSVVSRLKKAKRTAKVLLNSSVPPAGAEELSSAIANPPPKRPVRASCRVARRRKKTDESYHGRQKGPSTPVRAYDLRSSSCLQQRERMMTRLANKLRGNEVK